MLTIIFCWLVLFIAISLIGKLIVKNCEWYEYFWIGFVVVLGFLQIWSIFKPVNSVSLIFVLLIGFVSFIIYRKNIKFPNINFKLGITVSLLLLVISYYASQPVGWDDTLLYHLNAVKWGNLYAVVPGLANLHSRLGFNSSFFLFASMLNSWFMVDRASHISLSILATVLSVEYYYIFIRSVDRKLKLFCLFTMPLIIHSIVYREIVASLSPDFAQTIILLAAVVQFLKKEKKSILIGAFILIALITIKFSSLVFALSLLAFTLMRFKNYIKHVLLGIVIIVGPYLVRNVILSGWLLYPLPYLKFNVDWAVPAGKVNTLYKVIKTWAKVPGSEWVKFIDKPFWDWFPVWYQNNQNSIELKMLFISIFLLILIVLFSKKVKNLYIESKEIILIGIASILSMAYVFYTAPDLRFGGIFIWVFTSLILSLYISIYKWSSSLKFTTLLIFLLITINTSFPPRFDNEPILKSVRWDQTWPTKIVNHIYYPLKDNFCGNSSLPCTPEENKIKWREIENLSKGFAPVN